MTRQTPISSSSGVQRARGAVSLGVQRVAQGGSGLKTLRQEGSLRAIFPKAPRGALDAVILNTAGGVTGGDQFSVSASAGCGAQVSLTTQAAERIYRAAGPEAGRMTTSLRAEAGAQVFWLPQETILFEGSRLQRRLAVQLDQSARFLMVEPLVFGRAASGEALTSCTITDTVSIMSGDQPVYLDRFSLSGHIAASLSRPAIARGAGAMASVVLVAPDAHRHLEACRALLPVSAGVSALRDTVLVMRCLAEDSFALRGMILPVLRLLTNDAVPKNWRL